MPTFNLNDWQKVWPLKASHLQEAVDVIRPLMTMIGDGGITASQTQHGTAFSVLSDLFHLGYYPLLNNSGALRSRFDIVGLDSPLFDATKFDLFVSNFGFKGVIPTAPTHYGRWGVLQTPAKSGEYGLVKVDGVAVARIHINDPKHLCAGINSGDPTQLQSQPIAVAQILATSAVGGVTWAYIRFGTTFSSVVANCAGSGSGSGSGS